MIDVFFSHGMIVLESLPKRKHAIINGSSLDKQKFFDALPDKFSRNEAVALGTKFALKPPTVDKFLKKCDGKLLERPSFGNYRKLGLNK
jgi:hypothetical protein